MLKEQVSNESIITMKGDEGEAMHRTIHAQHANHIVKDNCVVSLGEGRLLSIPRIVGGSSDIIQDGNRGKVTR